MQAQKNLWTGCAVMASALTVLNVGFLWTAEQLGDESGLNGEATYILVLAVGGVAVLSFALLSWRNSVGLREEERQQEHLWVMQQGHQYVEPPDDQQ